MDGKRDLFIEDLRQKAGGDEIRAIAGVDTDAQWYLGMYVPLLCSILSSNVPTPAQHYCRIPGCTDYCTVNVT